MVSKNRYVYKIDISSGEKIDKFIKILQDNKIEGKLEACDDTPYYANKATTLGALATLEWVTVYFTCPEEVDELIKDFVLEKVVNEDV